MDRMFDRPTRIGLWQVLVLLIGIAGLVGAEVIQKWKTADGTLYFGDKPPPGSTKVGEEGTNAPAPAAEPASEGVPVDSSPGQLTERDRLSIAVSRERTGVERDLSRDAERLAEVRDKISEVERWPNVVEPWMEKSLGLGTDKNAALKKLRDERRGLATSMLKSWEKYDELDKRVHEGFGGAAPDWWRKISCAKCPSRSELGTLAE